MKITVFTPTFNRAYIIENLYKSLIKQKYYDFEWLVIDDGSTDNTKQLFTKWTNECNSFPIRYYYFENSGKQREINRALDLAKGRIFITVDSDDILTDDALLKIDRWDKEIIAEGADKICCLAGRQGTLDKHSIGPELDEPYDDANFLNRYLESGKFIGHDRAWAFYTEIHKKYKYPEIENEKFITEAVAWNRMANDGYKVRCYNDVIYLMEHQADGLTASIENLLLDNPRGYGIWIKEMMNYLQCSKWKKFKRYYSFYCDLHEKYSWRLISKYLDIPFWFMAIMHVLFKVKNGK